MNTRENITTLSDNLWHQNQRQESLKHLHQAIAAYRKARKTAQLDETMLEYMGQLEGFLDWAVCRTLEAERPLEAFGCIQESKASILADLKATLSAKPEPEPEAVHVARKSLTNFLRSHPGDLSTEEAVGAHQERHRQHVEHYLATHRISQAGKRRGELPDTPPASLEEIQGQLADGWAILDFWRTTNEEFAIFLVTRGHFEVHRVTFPVEAQANFSPNLRALQDLMANPLACLEDGANDTALDDLHACLFAPIRGRLRELGITGLYLVPQGYLHHLPLHAVRRKVKGEVRYLCDDFTIAYLPSSAALPGLPRLHFGGACLSLANPDRGSDNTLPFSEWEAKELCARRPNSRLHRGPEATLENTTDWERFDLLHFSCHGSSDTRFAPLSRLYLRDDLLLAHDVTCRRPDLPTGALVVLNGCQTGMKDHRANDEGMGLMSAFLNRGASLVFATQWSVVDACAADMVLTFTDTLTTTQDRPAEALRLAQDAIRARTWDDFHASYTEAQKLFNAEEHPHEMKKLLTQRAWLAARCGQTDEAMDALGEVVPMLREGGHGAVAERLRTSIQTAVLSIRTRTKRVHPYDHPLLWSAFQLVGRVF